MLNTSEIKDLLSLVKKALPIAKYSPFSEKSCFLWHDENMLSEMQKAYQPNKRMLQIITKNNKILVAEGIDRTDVFINIVNLITEGLDAK